jgi:CDP-paratose 2-epimerase
VVTGSGGLIGSASVRHFVNEGLDVIGLENDMRSRFFGAEASTRPVSECLVKECGSSFDWLELDIRDGEGIDRLFREHAAELELVIHTAAQPSHDWAASEPLTDFDVNAKGTRLCCESGTP